jgi:hypothetical protein
LALNRILNRSQYISRWAPCLFLLPAPQLPSS